MPRVFIAKVVSAMALALFASVGTASAQLVNENLLVATPPGYHVDFQNKNANRLMTEMVPQAETIHDWTEMVTVQIFFNLKATPEQFVGRLANMWISACPGGTSTPIASGPENGYPAGLWMLICPKNPETGKPEWTWVKAVQGNDSFYVVQKAFRFAPSKDQVVQWVKYLRSVAVCDSRLPDRACPQVKN